MLATETKEQYLADFKKRRHRAGATDAAWFDKLRDAGMASFQTLGFPTTRIEEWKYTNVEPIASQSFILASGDACSVDAGALFSRSFLGADCHRLAFVNGVYAPQLSNLQGLPSGVWVQSLAEAIERKDATVAAQLGRYASHQSEAFVALNTAFVGGGAVVVVPPGCRLVQPVHLVFASAGDDPPVISHPRILIVVGAGSGAQIVESYIGFDRGRYFCNAVTELVGEADTVIEHCRLQQESDGGFHVGTLAAHLARGCRLTAHAVTLSGALVRNNVHVVLDGEGAECVLNGLYVANGTQHVDNFTEIEHAKPLGTSSELYKGILSGRAHGVFNGKIVVQKNAQKTNARQTNKNLLLSSDAAVNTKPQLEIYADDVKCSHGSTIGQIDADAMFYLRSRGLGVDEARSLLSFAFASEVIGKIKIEGLRRQLDGHLAALFHRE
jgi:Fe-S cluster assembly protein SufD